tara:strand:+ start:401 stop:511 length:111 start_codon:yes stop_codon:yes gene_type:complete
LKKAPSTNLRNIDRLLGLSIAVLLCGCFWLAAGVLI